jgi:gliding-associated putative ABC transporter substrate-binding component GldG
MAEKKKITKGLFNWTFLGIVVIALILINIISSFLYTRIDMTEDQRYSLTNGTVAFLENEEQFKNRISIKIYLEGNLPAEIKHFRDEIEAKLVEFKQIAGDRIEYQFLDPNVGTEGEKQALFEQLYAKGKGIMPLEIVYMKDGSQSKMMLWPGAVIDYGGTTVQTIQFLPGTPVEHPYVLDELTDLIDNSTKNLEYILVSSLRKTTQVKKPRIAFLQGHGELNFQQTQRVRSLIAPYFSIADITINDSVAALDNVDGLIIARPTQKFSDKDLFVIDQFVMKGGRLMCFIDALYLNEDTLNRNGSTHTMRYETGIERMLFDYGLKLNDNYVVDVSCVDKPVPFANQSKIPWFFHVLATPTKHPISRNLEPVSLKYTSQVDSISGETYKFSTVLTSSTNASVTGLAPMVSLGMPLNYGENPVLVPNPTEERNKVILAGLTEGKYESHFKNRIVEEYSNNPAARFLAKSSKEGKVLLIGNGRLIANSYDSMPARNGQGYMYRPTQFNDLRMDLEMASINIPVYFGNQEFFQNLVDYMLGDNSVLDIRSRQIDIHAIDKEKVKADATFYKIINLLIPVVLVLIFAFVMGIIRKRKYVQK